MKGHNWVAVVSYQLDESTVRALASRGHGLVKFDGRDRVALQIGCWDCELPYEIAKDLSCRPSADARRQGGMSQ